MRRCTIILVAIVLAATCADVKAQGGRPPRRRPRPERSPASGSDAKTRGLGYGIWSIDVPTGKSVLLLALRGAGDAVARDKTMVAVIGASSEELRELNRPSPDRRADPTASGQARMDMLTGLRLGPPGGALRTVWGWAEARKTGLPLQSASLRWSGNGKRVLAERGRNLLVLSHDGRAVVLGEAARKMLAPSRVPRGVPEGVRPLAASEDIELQQAQWAGNSDRAIVVGRYKRASQERPRKSQEVRWGLSALEVLDLSTGASRALCPCPPGFRLIGDRKSCFQVSDDLGVVMFFGPPAAGGGESKGDCTWVWRRGRQSPALIGEAGRYPSVLSGDGKHVVVFSDRTSLYETANGKLVWEVDDSDHRWHFYAAAFSPNGKELVLIGRPKDTGQWHVAYSTPVGKADLRPFARSRMGVWWIRWSADGAEVLVQSRPGGLLQIGNVAIVSERDAIRLDEQCWQPVTHQDPEARKPQQREASPAGWPFPVPIPDGWKLVRSKAVGGIESWVLSGKETARVIATLYVVRAQRDRKGGLMGYCGDVAVLAAEAAVGLSEGSAEVQSSTPVSGSFPKGLTQIEIGTMGSPVTVVKKGREGKGTRISLIGVGFEKDNARVVVAGAAAPGQTNLIRKAAMDLCLGIRGRP